MVNYSMAICVTPLPILDEYPEIRPNWDNCPSSKYFRKQSVAIRSKPKSKFYESEDSGLTGLQVWTNEKNCYVWYLKSERCHSSKITFFTETGPIKKLITDFIKTKFNYTDKLEIVFSVKDFEEIAATSRSIEIKNEKGEEITIYDSLLEKQVLAKIIEGEREQHMIYDEETELAASNVVPPESTGKYTWAELIKAITRFTKEYNLFFSPADTIIDFLPYYYAKEFLEQTFTFKGWENQERVPYTREGVISRMKNRHAFLSEKLEDNREMSIAKATIQLQTLCWLLGDNQFDDDDPYRIKSHVESMYLNGEKNIEDD
jgi:hypothetical protein